MYRNESSFGHRTDAAFISAGFRNWKKAIAKFTAHQNSQAHRYNVTVSAHQQNPHGLNSSRWQDIVEGKLLVLWGMWQNRDKP